MNNQESIAVKLALTEKEYIFLSLYMKMKSTIFVLTCFFFLYVAVFYLIIDVTLLINIIISAFLILFIILPMVLFVLSYRAKKEFRSSRSLQQEVIVEFSKLGYDLTTEHESNHRGWDYIYSVRELKNSFVVYYSAYTATLYPKRCFDSKQDTEVFKELVSKHIESNKVYFKTKH